MAVGAESLSARRGAMRSFIWSWGSLISSSTPAHGNNDGDEKVHKAHHKSYFEGVPFKGWRNETVIARSEGGDPVILVTDENSHIWNSKLKEVITVVEKELGFAEG
ncbi:protein CHROMOSOME TRANSMISSION FIDELITY 7 isoform X1 [Panicum miliaceum]|uniref:Protein CHROMOSOME TRANSMISSION FIDELITY 7 isoform X1 n=1 Tax=Panicum miliaceum TaxID=4540 RepID=A0A3L6TV95_PANMI|nr:protein CHROMOSOME TRANSMISSION FIDELITY 7 isoform X1 [Panicum miliaceum]